MSNLGPRPLNSFVNDMPEYVNDCTLIQYADDTQFLHSLTLIEVDLLINQTDETIWKAKVCANDEC